jgi:hypothetical protein
VPVPAPRPLLTLLQYFERHGNVAATANSIAEAVLVPQIDEDDHPVVFMEDLETYKTH